METVSQIFTKVLELTIDGKIKWTKDDSRINSSYRGTLRIDRKAMGFVFISSTGTLVGFSNDEKECKDVFRVIIENAFSEALEAQINVYIPKPPMRTSSLLYLANLNTFLSL